MAVRLICMLNRKLIRAVFIVGIAAISVLISFGGCYYPYQNGDPFPSKATPAKGKISQSDSAAITKILLLNGKEPSQLRDLVQLDSTGRVITLYFQKETGSVVYNGQIDTLPPDIFACSGLRNLHIARNHLSCLPEPMDSFKYLEVLEANGNDFQEIPESLYRCTSLKNLCLGDEIISVDSGVGRLTNLTSLALYGGLAVLPVEFGNLTGLKGLALDYNKLSALPGSILNLSNEDLYVSVEGNYLVDVPDSIASWLDVHANSYGYNWRDSQKDPDSLTISFILPE